MGTAILTLRVPQEINVQLGKLATATYRSQTFLGSKAIQHGNQSARRIQLSLHLLYRIHRDGVEILRVFHTVRRWSGFF